MDDTCLNLLNESITSAIAALKVLTTQLINTKSKIKLKPSHQRESNGKGRESNASISATIANCLRDVSKERFSKIAGYQNVKSTLLSVIKLPITQPQLYKNFSTKRSVLLYGPPGTGKTKLAMAIAGEVNAMFLSVSSSNILSKYIGESEKAIRDLFDFVKQNDCPTVLFLDEVDALCRKRVEEEAEYSRRIKTEIMSQLNDFGACENSSFLVCATNCPWEIDTAFKRRMQQLIYVPLPNDNERFQLLQMYSSKGNFQELSVQQWCSVVNATKGFSGSDIENLVSNALMKPIHNMLQTNTWRRLEGDRYEPIFQISPTEEFSNVVVQDAQNLPNGSIKEHESSFWDLIDALQETQRSVSTEEVEKFEQYRMRN